MQIILLYLFDRLGKILIMLILTLDRKVTMILLTSVKLGTRYVLAFCLLFVQFLHTVCEYHLLTTKFELCVSRQMRVYSFD